MEIVGNVQNNISNANVIFNTFSYVRAISIDVKTHVSTLCYASSTPQPTLYLAHMHHTWYPNDFQISIVMVGFAKLVLSFRTPWVGTRCPTVTKKKAFNSNTFYKTMFTIIITVGIVIKILSGEVWWISSLFHLWQIISFSIITVHYTVDCGLTLVY